ncbi:filamentous hemagglutinin N-terminal domain-containing protein, partial [Rhizobium sp. BR 314]|uniref:two-partner secretion domain-containing protein n=1 Tax=Rhizobium sp. BR 314 TaxID=3040013 RepID=UPI0039BF3847
MTRQTTHMTLSHRTRLVALLASTALAHSTAVLAQSLPSGGQVAAGSATIGAPSAGSLTINQTSGSAVVNWQSFDVGKGNRVTFVQPDANSAILNRVTGQTSSTIAGQINANGQVYLINPNGIA